MKGYLSCSFISLISIAIFFVLAGKTNAWNVSPCVSLFQSKFTASSFSSFFSSGSSSEMRRMAYGVTDLTKMSSAITTRRRRMVAVSSTTTTQARLFGHYYKSGSHAATRFPTTTTNLHFDGRQSSVVSLASFRGSDRSCRTVLSVARSSNDGDSDNSQSSSSSSSSFHPGQPIQVEVISFGPLGASVDVIGEGHDPDNLLPEGEEPLAKGLVLQREIKYFRERRGNVDVVRGEVLPAYVERVRDTGRLDISLRVVGGKAKAQDLSLDILDALAKDGQLNIGDKSAPEDIARLFPGTSKSAFKKAVSLLYKQGKVQPGPNSIQLVSKEDK